VVTVYLIFAGVLFFIGLYCLLTSRNMVKILIGLEVMAKSVVVALATAGYARGTTYFSQSLLITFIVIEVSLVAVALALVINSYRNTESLDIRQLTKLRG
jgi:NADH:ubiquinone oxidoreductase subunit K